MKLVFLLVLTYYLHTVITKLLLLCVNCYLRITSKLVLPLEFHDNNKPLTFRAQLFINLETFRAQPSL